LIGVGQDSDQLRNSSPSDWPQSLRRSSHCVTLDDLARCPSDRRRGGSRLRPRGSGEAPDEHPVAAIRPERHSAATAAISFRRLAAFGACSGRRFWASASHPSALSTAESCPDPGTWLASFRPARLQRCDEHVDTAAPCRVWRSAPRLHPAARTIYSSRADVSAGESGGSPWPQVSYSSSSFRSFAANSAGSLSGDHSLAAKPP
jgi:hypothetical protein